MLPFTIEPIIAVMMFFVGVYAALEMRRAAERSVLEWRTAGRHVTTPRKRRQSVLILVASFLFGIVVLPHLPIDYALLFLPFSLGIVFGIAASILHDIMAQK